MLASAKFIGSIFILIFCIVILCLAIYVYWLLASWFVDSIIGFNGLEAIATKIIIFLFICGLINGLNKFLKSKE